MVWIGSQVVSGQDTVYVWMDELDSWKGGVSKPPAAQRAGGITHILFDRDRRNKTYNQQLWKAQNHKKNTLITKNISQRKSIHKSQKLHVCLSDGLSACPQQKTLTKDKKHTNTNKHKETQQKHSIAKKHTNHIKTKRAKKHTQITKNTQKPLRSNQKACFWVLL